VEVSVCFIIEGLQYDTEDSSTNEKLHVLVVWIAF